MSESSTEGVRTPADNGGNAPGQLASIRKEAVPTMPTTSEKLAAERHLLEVERVKAERLALQHEQDEKGESFQQFKDADKRRWAVAKIIFSCTGGWLLAILLVVLLEGWKLLGFELGDPGLVALLSTTTVTVFGVTLVVTQFLFRAEQPR